MYGKALVMGMGRSGLAAARLLLGEGSAVTIVDRSAGAAVADRASALATEGASVVPGCVELPDGQFDICIVSPGIPFDSDWVRAIRGRGVEAMAELELGAARCGARLLAVTGSKGKSTMCKLTGEALALAGRRVAIGGNYGTPLSELATGSEALDWIVVEVSSFQLEGVRTFRPAVGVLLNVQPDHLDRHGDMDAYMGLKAGMFDGMGKQDVGIVLEDCLGLVRGQSRGTNRWVSFGLSARADYRYRSGVVVAGEGEGATSVVGTRFDNEIMGRIAAASVAAVVACGADPECVGRAAEAFETLPHRMQEVATVNGVRFVDDSKATSLTALQAGLTMAGGGVRLIAGGMLKERDLEWVKEVLASHTRKVYLIGQAARAMQEAWRDTAPCELCGCLDKAVGLAWREAEPGDVILLSPGCASFDQFDNFEDRGRKFAEAVAGIARQRVAENVAEVPRKVDDRA